MSENKKTYIEEIIPRGKKKLLESLKKFGIKTLEDCAVYDACFLRRLDYVGEKTIKALKRHSLRKGIEWLEFESNSKKIVPIIMSKYNFTYKQARACYRVIYYESGGSALELSSKKTIF